MTTTTRGRTKGKGLVRSLVRRSTKTGKARPSEGGRGRLREPAACERCGAVFSRRVWRRTDQVSYDVLARAQWVVCPSCRQVEAQVYLGRVVLRGAGVVRDEALLRRRIENVAARAGATQPERRIVSVERQGEVLEVLTTSQKLAHRIVHEVTKLLGGRTTYRWSDDRTLLATWQGPAARSPKARAR
jgi:NMD protein affecting ribosome stability and mRNA decay